MCAKTAKYYSTNNVMYTQWSILYSIRVFCIEIFPPSFPQLLVSYQKMNFFEKIYFKYLIKNTFKLKYNYLEQ